MEEQSVDYSDDASNTEVIVNTVSHLKGARKNFLLNAYELAYRFWYGIDDFEEQLCLNPRKHNMTEIKAFLLN